MTFGECKVYSDGSHYIAIPHKPSKNRKRPKPPDEIITVVEDETANDVEEVVKSPQIKVESNNNAICEQVVEGNIFDESITKCKLKREKKMTRKELFEQLYDETKNLKRTERKKLILKKMRPYFENEEETEIYVQIQLDRKIRNLICRRVRLARKVNLADFNYFCTFTYDGVKHTEESFRKKLGGCFKMMCHRKSWRYVGVWERSPMIGRLHFHGLFDIPNGTLPGTFSEITDYNTTKNKMQTAKVNSYFWERFGRNDFKEIDSRAMLGESIAYLTKYMEKTGEKIVYSKNLPQYFISDIMDDDVVCTIGQEDRKLLLFDDFTCWDEGCYIGTVSADVIKKMRKVN